MEINGVKISVGWWSVCGAIIFLCSCTRLSSNLNGKSMGGRQYNRFLLSTRESWLLKTSKKSVFLTQIFQKILLELVYSVRLSAGCHSKSTLVFTNTNLFLLRTVHSFSTIKIYSCFLFYIIFSNSILTTIYIYIYIYHNVLKFMFYHKILFEMTVR